MPGESRSELLTDNKKLFDYLSQHLDDMQRVLDEEVVFCTRDVDASMGYIEQMEQQFQMQIQQLKTKLESIRKDNSELFKSDLEQLKYVSETVEELYQAGKYSEALDKFEAHQKSFQERNKLNHNIPKLHMNERDIERHFGAEQQPTAPPVQPPNSIAALVQSWNIDDDDAINEKREIRAQKVIETDALNDEDKSESNGRNDQKPIESAFGRRSRPQENEPPPLPPSTINNTMTNNSASSVPSAAPPRKFMFSTRLNQVKSKPNGTSCDRQPPLIPDNNVNSQNDHGQQASPQQNIQLKPVTLNRVVLYTLEENHHLIMACVGRDIALFKCQLNRLDRWRLATIERGTENVRELPWHDGLLISMGFTDRQLLYMFTEREFLIYSMGDFQKRVSRLLPRGNDDDSDLSAYAYPASQRGIGTVYDKHMYHLYLNRNNHWTLSKNILHEVVHMHDYDLTLLFPEVERFVQFSVNEKTISFLVQLHDLSYAVAFCSVHNLNRNECPLPVVLVGAQRPLTICSAYLPKKNSFQFYINDPSIDFLHVVDTAGYLHYHLVKAHAICHVAAKHELLVVTENCICSLNLN